MASDLVRQLELQLQQLRRHLGNRRSLWLLLVSLLFTWNTALLWWADLNPSLQVLNLVAWFGCVIAMEDRLPDLWPRPSRTSALLGGTLLVLLLWRGTWFFTNQYQGLYDDLLMPLQVLALGLLNQPVRRFGLFRLPLIIAMLYPLGQRVHLLQDHLIPLTAASSWIMLSALGFQPVLDGNALRLARGAVEIGSPCSGIEQLVVTVSVAIIFLLVFPLQNWRHRLAVLILAGVVAFLTNAFRIALLAWLVDLPKGSGMVAFDFLHDSYGGLVFSLAAVWILGAFYTRLIDVELAAREPVEWG